MILVSQSALLKVPNCGESALVLAVSTHLSGTWMFFGISCITDEAEVLETNPYSVNSMPCKMSHASIPAHVRAERSLPEDLIRLCVGIEDADDLLEDLETALVNSGCLLIGDKLEKLSLEQQS